MLARSTDRASTTAFGAGMAKLCGLARAMLFGTSAAGLNPQRAALYRLLSFSWRYARGGRIAL
ncbi:hypothetical protein [Klebsiella phage vB_KshKPC-M]|nr:hypothetical protein [Klebsiella phage vB_KshKPC-M]